MFRRRTVGRAAVSRATVSDVQGRPQPGRVAQAGEEQAQVPGTPRAWTVEEVHAVQTGRLLSGRGAKQGPGLKGN